VSPRVPRARRAFPSATVAEPVVEAREIALFTHLMIVARISRVNARAFPGGGPRPHQAAARLATPGRPAPRCVRRASSMCQANQAKLIRATTRAQTFMSFFKSVS
jgi:hypothetical protein